MRSHHTLLWGHHFIKKTKQKYKEIKKKQLALFSVAMNYLIKGSLFLLVIAQVNRHAMGFW
jgi:hypothetical protein